MKYKVVLIEEGLGNFGDMFYYTRQALESAVKRKIFEGAKCYANHPDAMEEKIRPERSVRDIVGHFESVHIEAGSKGQALLVGDLIMLDTPETAHANAMLERAVGFGDQFGKEFIGLSINASGDAEQMPLEEFVKEGNIPESALPKLQAAQEKGISEVNVCTQLTEAVSCDLVTEAGAKGRTLKMLEGARLKMALPKKTKTKAAKITKESEKKETEGKEAEEAKSKEAEESEEAAGEDDGHDDKEQDEKLIKEMLQKYLGGKDHSEESHEAMKQAYENAKEMGMEGEEAEKAAGYSMKMAHHVASKQAEAEESEESAEGKAPPKAPAKPDADGDDDGDEDDSEEAPAKEKKMEREVLSLRGQVAGLVEKLAKKERAEHLDTVLRESKLPEAAAKKFRESVKPKHTVEQITENLKFFREAYGLGGQSAGAGELFILPEKTTTDNGSGLSFADCVKE